ncbi:glycosyltransferase [Cyclobacterium salsum]|uniref:glycosyltransferase n=1 Tax=Cyclobacterium salsum TaxID=2666329 RepID=UPI0013920894|nr:glycosyltransferase [Cyclobacterium salsum]
MNTNSSDQIFVSVIIPTYLDWGRLAECLNSLSKQTYDSNLFEIIVINNAPNDERPPYLTVPINCLVLNESKSGSYAARNRGIQMAKGEIIAFTDSDCIPDPNWIKNAVNLFSICDCDRIGGRIDLFYRSKILNSAELYEKIYAFKQDQSVKASSSAVTGNMFTYRKVFDKIGFFNEKMLSGGDHEWAKRAAIAGFEIIYGKDVVVKHPARNNIKQLKMKAKRVAGGRVLDRKKGKIRAILRLILAFIPKFRSIYSNLNAYGSDLSCFDKTKVFLVKYYLNIVSATEELLIFFGKKSLRQ